MTLELSYPQPLVPESLRGPRSLLRRRIRRVIGHVLARVNNSYFDTALGRWLHADLKARLEVCEVAIALPAASARIEWPTIGFLSDLHAGHYMTARDLERLADLVMAFEPDLLCLGGDLINQHEHELELLWPALAKLRAPLGVFAVPGNHDYAVPDRLEGWVTKLEQHGVRVLRNAGVRLAHRGHSLWLGGVDDLTEGEPRLVDALAGRRAGEATLLLSHHPDLFREASARAVDLQLSGHTHGGQVRLFGWAPMHHSRFDWYDGLYERGDSRLYVGRGAGVTALPIRIGTRAEVTLIRPHSPGLAGV